jgi:cytochrome c-type biogenesis protein CcmH
MTLWIAMAVLAAAVSLSVLVPLYRTRRFERRMAGQEVSVYRDQLDEVGRDRDRGLIADTEAEAARTEIARRLIRADGAKAKAAAEDSGELPRRVAAVGAVLAMPLLALGFYLFVGSPDLPDAPLAARLTAPPEGQDIAALVARVEEHLAANPEDGRGWQVLAPVYVRLGRHGDAVRAYANVVRLLGSNAESEGDLGEAMVRANQGTVTADAAAAFVRARQADPEAVRPRFYLALALGQEGRTDEAAAAIRGLIAGAPPGAPWIDGLRGALARLETATPPPQPGPTSADVEAAGDLSASDRSAMIVGMVAELADRLESEPGDAEGWARLVRSYMVLGRPDDARAALGRARAALEGNTDKLALVESEARAMGLTE